MAGLALCDTGRPVPPLLGVAAAREPVPKVVLSARKAASTHFINLTWTALVLAGLRVGVKALVGLAVHTGRAVVELSYWALIHTGGPLVFLMKAALTELSVPELILRTVDTPIDPTVPLTG